MHADKMLEAYLSDVILELSSLSVLRPGTQVATMDKLSEELSAATAIDKVDKLRKLDRSVTKH